MDTNNIIYADVTSISQIPHGATSHGYSNNWEVYYEYDDGNFLYEGYIYVSGKETAEGYIGGKIPIYIDGQGHSISVAAFNERKEIGSTKKALIIAIICLVCFIIFIGIAIFLFLKQRKKIKILSNQSDA